jgi:hypothetical protein
MSLPQTPIPLEYEVHSPKTSALITFLLRSHAARTRNEGSHRNIFTQVKRDVGAGTIKDPIDESFEDFQQWINLIDNGPGAPVSGKSVCEIMFMILSHRHAMFGPIRSYSPF